MLVNCCDLILQLEFKQSDNKLVIYNVHLDVASGIDGLRFRTESLKLILQKYNEIKEDYPNAIILGELKSNDNLKNGVKGNGGYVFSGHAIDNIDKIAKLEDNTRVVELCHKHNLKVKYR